MKTKPKLKTNRSITLSKVHSLLYRANMSGAVEAAKNARTLNREIVALEREAGKLHEAIANLEARIQSKRDEFKATQEEQAELRSSIRELIGEAHGIELPEVAVRTDTDDGLVKLAWHEEEKPAAPKAEDLALELGAPEPQSEAPAKGEGETLAPELEPKAEPKSPRPAPKRKKAAKKRGHKVEKPLEQRDRADAPAEDRQAG